MFSRGVVEGRLIQGENERIAYQITTTPWGSSPSSPTFKLWEITAGVWTDVTLTKTSGAPSVLGDVITLPLVVSLVADHMYRGVAQFVSGGNTFEAYFEIQAEK